ncbi:YdcH family protein [Thalassobius sp. MITS945101]|uniref:YdcH family protein n=1 Tax=Thalassobius sp. MITS945101 TaxID=3096994 RepID=UPI0039997599
MSNTPHELAEEFPELAEKMSALKVSDAHFAKLAEEYHTLNRAVHRAETNVEPVEQLVEADMRKKRAALKDEIYSYLKETA